jgi:hypothetical protein
MHLRIIKMSVYQVWYMKPDWFVAGLRGTPPDATKLDTTHVHLKDVDVAQGPKSEVWGDLERVFAEMQGEVWSPNGEARPLVLAKGLRHTSMSVGDIVICHAGGIYVVADIGYICLRNGKAK